MDVAGNIMSASQCLSSTPNTSESVISGMSSSCVETSEEAKEVNKSVVAPGTRGGCSLLPPTSCSRKSSVDPVVTEVRLEVGLNVSKSAPLLREDVLELLDDLEEVEEPEDEA